MLVVPCIVVYLAKVRFDKKYTRSQKHGELNLELGTEPLEHHY